MTKLFVTAHPNSKNPRLIELSQNSYQIYIATSPIDGKANQQIINVLAKHLKVAKSRLQLVRGHKSKQKVLELSD
ncbi:MAG: DUF167 domain-containing protein [Candidatus Doudnabacteria bacterium]